MDLDYEFNANNKPLADVLFDTARKYRVPRYQRPYAWGIEEVSEFWEDLVLNDKPYFFGSFIFNTEHEDEDRYVDIIDGQQRLLTITIFVAAIRDVAKDIDLDSSKLYHRKDIAIEDWEGEHYYRILPSETLIPFFHDHIQDGTKDILQAKTSTPEEARIRANYEYLLKKVKAEVDRFPSLETKLEVLSKLRKKVRSLIVINVEINREEDAYEIFETTNARGMELSVADLLKNLIFKNIKPGEDRDLAKEVWLEITGNVESTNTDLKRFIRYFWLSKHNFVTEKKLYREIKTKIANWQVLLQDLWDASGWYNRLLEGDERDFQDLKNSSKIFESVFATRLMGVSQCYVLFLSILRNYGNLGTDPAHVFALIEKFSFQYSVVCKLPGNRLEKIYSKAAQEIEKAATSMPTDKRAAKIQSIFTSLEKEVKEIAPSEALFKDSFTELALKNSEESRWLTKYILGRINGHLQKTDEFLINFNKVNIEHILPQNPDKDWKLTKKEIKPYVNRLGNLTLLSQKINSKIQNSTAVKKLPELDNSELAITVRLVESLKAHNAKWGDGAITERQSEMADISYEHVWKL